MTGPEHPTRVVLLGKPDCHLCEEARAVVAAVCAAEGVGWEERDVRADEATFARYRDEIPVTFVDGQQHDVWRVDPERLRAALRHPRSPRRVTRVTS